MNEQLQNELAKFLSAINSGVDFIGGQAPALVTQLVQYKTIELALLSVIGLAMVISSIFLWLSMRSGYLASIQNDTSSWAWDRGGSMTASGVIAFLWSVFGGLIGFCFSISAIQGFVKITIAPKIWLIEYAASLAK